MHSCGAILSHVSVFVLHANKLFDLNLSLDIIVSFLQLLFETVIDHMANFTVSSQTFEMVKVSRILF